MAEDSYSMSEKTFAEFKEKLAYLKGQKRDEIIHRIEFARGLGDLSENAEYDEARNEQRENEAEIERLDAILARADVYSLKDLKCEKAELGNIVSVLCKWNGKTIDYSLVGSVEADPLAHKISNASPLGQALFGKKVGDTVEVQVPAGTREYEITGIGVQE